MGHSHRSLSHSGLLLQDDQIKNMTYVKFYKIYIYLEYPYKINQNEVGRGRFFVGFL
jgi:hypothetical protein